MNLDQQRLDFLRKANDLRPMTVGQLKRIVRDIDDNTYVRLAINPEFSSVTGPSAALHAPGIGVSRIEFDPAIPDDEIPLGIKPNCIVIANGLFTPTGWEVVEECSYSTTTLVPPGSKEGRQVGEMTID